MQGGHQLDGVAPLVTDPHCAANSTPLLHLVICQTLNLHRRKGTPDTRRPWNIFGLTLG